MSGYPGGDLGAQAELLLGGAWTAATPMPDGAQYGDITSGQDDGADGPSPTAITVNWDNPDGKLSPRNISSPYYGQLKQNTLARISLASPYGNYLRLEDDSVSLAGALGTTDITGDIDIRIMMDLSDWRASVLASRWVGPSAKAWVLALNDDGTVHWEYYTGSVNLAKDSTIPLPPGLLALRVTLDVNDGAGGHLSTIYTGPSLDGPWTELGDAATASGTVAIATAVAPVVVGYSSGYIVTDNHPGFQGLTGSVYGFRLYSGIGGTLEAEADFTAQAAGTTTWIDGQGNTWVLAGTAQISDRDFRVNGEVASLQPSVNTSGTQAQVAGQIAGLLRRLQQGDAPTLDSPMKRAILRQAGALAPAAYWPWEEMQAARQLASAISGPAMMFDVPPQLAADSSFACSLPLPLLNGSRLHGQVPRYTGSTALAARWLCKLGTLPVSGGEVLVRLITTGTCRELTVRAYSGGGLGLSGWAADGSNVFDTGSVAFSAGGKALWYSIEATPVSGGQQFALVTLAPGAPAGSSTSHTVSGGVHGNVTDVWVNPQAFFTDTAAGHFQVQGAWVSLFSLAGPLMAWDGERAADRFGRLCGEEGITSRIYGPPGRSAVMGLQGIDTLGNLLQDCEDADQGLMYEPRETGGLGYRVLRSMLNQAPRVTLDYAAANLRGNLQPADDDQDLVNDVTVQRPDGSSARVVLDDGSPLSVSKPRDGGAGRYASTFDANVKSDGQLLDAAGQRLRAGTVDEARFRQVPFDFGIPGAPAADAARLRPGDLLEADNPPVTLQTDSIRQIATGAEETFGPGRVITWSCTPAAAYDTAVYDDFTRGRADTAGSALHAAMAAASPGDINTILVDSATIPWTANGLRFPVDLNIGGERVTVLDIRGAPPNFLTGANAGFEGGIGNWSAGLLCTVAASTAQAHSGTGSLKMTATAAGTMTTVSCLAGNLGTQGLPCVGNDLISGSAWFRALMGAVQCTVQIGFYTSTPTLISTVTSTAVADETTGWVKAHITKTPAPLTSAHCRLIAAAAAVGVGDQHFTDDAYLGNATTGASSQQMIIVRGVNGAAPAHSAGDPVRLWYTPRYAPV